MQPEAKMSSGQATFDLKAAREAMARATERPNVTTDIYHLAALTYLPAALDEIERQRAREKEFVLASSKRTQFALDTAKFWIDQYERQAKHIAELEAEVKTQKEYVLLMHDRINKGAIKSGRIFLRNRKLLAALKKLGQAKRERGKALVEERARFNVAMKVVPLNTSFPNSDHKKAREQLRREGKL